MKITVEHGNTKIIIEESENQKSDKVATIRYSDQNKLIQETIVVICEQIKKLNNIKSYE